MKIKMYYLLNKPTIIKCVDYKREHIIYILLKPIDT